MPISSIFIHDEYISNFKQILSNKFILFSLLYQGIDIGKLFLVQKFFQYIPAGKMASFFAAKEDNPVNYLIKLSLLKLVKELSENNLKDFANCA